VAILTVAGIARLVRARGAIVAAATAISTTTTLRATLAARVLLAVHTVMCSVFGGVRSLVMTLMGAGRRRRPCLGGCPSLILSFLDGRSLLGGVLKGC
jgi:hypothetical protein